MISIIVPVFNVQKYLPNCIQSIIEQTYKDIEIILVNDGSTDSSLSICDKYAEKDNRIHVYSQQNGGLSSARNTGLEYSSGEYIMFVDSDDFLHVKAVEIMYEYLEKYNTDMVACKFKAVYEHDSPECRKDDISVASVQELNRNQAFLHLNDIQVVAWNKIYKREIFHSLRFPVGRLHEDEFMFHQIVFKCDKIVYIDCELYFYLLRGNSITTTKNMKRFYDAYDALEERFNFTIQKQWIEVIDAAYDRVYEYLIDQYFKNINDKKIVKYIKNKSRLLAKYKKTYSLQFQYKLFIFSPRLYLSYIKIYRFIERIHKFIKRKLGINEKN